MKNLKPKTDYFSHIFSYYIIPILIGFAMWLVLQLFNVRLKQIYDTVQKIDGKIISVEQPSNDTVTVVLPDSIPLFR